MSAWIDPIARALDARAASVTIFFRDDDAGWGDEALFALLALFDRHEAPLDLAVIPNAISPQVATRLAHRARSSGHLGLHQHGLAHVNHEPSGRPAEFGPARAAEVQRHDIDEGRQRLVSLFGDELDPIFTPPWNRCSAVTGACLVDAGVTGLSRDESAGRLGVTGLLECPITSDWLGKRKGVRLTRDDWAAAFALAIATKDAPVGVMLHHALMDDENREAFGLVLGLVRRHSAVRLLRMREAAGIATAAQRPETARERPQPPVSSPSRDRLPH